MFSYDNVIKKTEWSEQYAISLKTVSSGEYIVVICARFHLGFVGQHPAYIDTLLYGSKGVRRGWLSRLRFAGATFQSRAGSPRGHRDCRAPGRRRTRTRSRRSGRPVGPIPPRILASVSFCQACLKVPTAVAELISIGYIWSRCYLLDLQGSLLRMSPDTSAATGHSDLNGSRLRSNPGMYQGQFCQIFCSGYSSSASGARCTPA